MVCGIVGVLDISWAHGHGPAVPATPTTPTTSAPRPAPGNGENLFMVSGDVIPAATAADLSPDSDATPSNRSAEASRAPRGYVCDVPLASCRDRVGQSQPGPGPGSSREVTVPLHGPS